jgi:pyruvate-formate lyase-activating enzyme
MQTNIYHITQFDGNSAYLNFLGCRWRCKGCVRVLGWDSHLSSSDREKLGEVYGKTQSSLRLQSDEVIKILKESNAKKLYLGGYEPTLDPNIVEILGALKNEGFLIKLVTNGEFLSEQIMEAVDEVTLSIKALDDELHKTYTGVSNKKTLRSFERFHNSEKIEVETIYIPGLVECDEVMKIASYVAGYNKNLAYRIDRFHSYGGFERDATLEEVRGCLEKVKEILPNAYTFASRKKPDYAKCLYPKIS